MRLSRREILERLGAAAAASVVAGAADPSLASERAHATRPATAEHADELCFTSGRELARLIRTRKVSAREVMQAHLRQIERVNPKVNAIVAKLDDAQCLALAESSTLR